LSEAISSIWQGCRVLVHASDAVLEFEDDDVEVKQVGDVINVVYWDDDGPVVFGGVRQDEGSFDLVCRSRPRTATLRWADDGRRLEGTWRQGDEQGTWVIVVHDG
jgi:hypothetical protein